MPPTYKTTPSTSITVPISPLTPAAFSPFGTVIENPRTTPSPSSTVNQGTAAKHPQISPIVSYSTPSKTPSTSNINLFVCNPRELGDDGTTFEVKILERHPFTTQTFIPVGLDGRDVERRRYLVIVAPTLGGSAQEEEGVVKKVDGGTGKGLWRNITSLASFNPPHQQSVVSDSKIPLPSSSLSTNKKDTDVSGTTRQKGRGLPDLANLKAFVCNGSQAVTYGVGTWHAPMVVLGEGPVEFVVVMYENGVEGEDTEECDVEGGKVKVLVGGGGGSDVAIKAKL